MAFFFSHIYEYNSAQEQTEFLNGAKHQHNSFNATGQMATNKKKMFASIFLNVWTECDF